MAILKIVPNKIPTANGKKPIKLIRARSFYISLALNIVQIIAIAYLLRK